MATKQTVYRVENIVPPPGCSKWSAMRGRAELTAFTENQALFHRENNVRIQEPASIRYRGGRNGFGITVVDTIDEDLEFSIAKALMAFAAEHDGVFDMRSFQCNIEKTAQKVSYRSILVIGRTPKHIKPHSYKDNHYPERIKLRHDFNERINSDPTFRDEEIKWAITKGISRQFQRLLAQGGFSLKDGYFLGRVDGNELLKKSAQDFIDSIDLKKVEALPPAKRYLPRYFIEFEMPVDLRGDWAVGKLNQKGYGQLIKINKNEGKS